MHVADLAGLVRTAIEHPVPAAVLHAVAETTNPCRVASAIARLLDQTPVAVADDQADHLPFVDLLRAHQRIDAHRTRTLFAWTPTRPAIEDDLAHGSYHRPDA